MAGDVSLGTTSSSLLSGSIKWSGLSTGTDFASIVDQLIEIERTQIKRLEAWKETWEAKIESIEGFNSRLASLKYYCQDNDTFSEFYTRTSSSTNTSVVTTTNTSTATPGSHTVLVGQDIPALSASKSYQSAAAVGGAGGGDFTLTVGGTTLTLHEGVEWSSADTLADLASAINYYDNSAGWGGQDILGDVYTLVDKTRSGVVYRRLIVTAKSGGSLYEMTIAGGPSSALGLDRTSLDAALNKTWLGTASAISTGTYTGSTNKTFTFTPIETGTIGQGAITVRWADTDGNAGAFDVNSAGVNYEVRQGVFVQFTSGMMIKDDTFTIDAYHPVLQAAQDDGLAQVEQEVHEGFGDLLTAVTSADAVFVYWYEGEEIQVDVTADTKLQGLADAINKDTDNPGVVATIINDGLNTATSYHLVLTGRHTGAPHTIEISSATTLTNFSVLDASGNSTFETAQKATDAVFKVDGYPSDAAKFIHRSTNTVADVIDGVVLDFHGVGQATVTVGDDVAAVEEKVELLVNSVNFVLDYIRQETKYDADTGEAGVMLGNYTYDLVRNAINEILYETIPGLDTSVDVYTHLAQIGIQTDPDQDGKWIINSSTLSNALNTNLEAVARLFVRDDDRGSEGVNDRLREKLEALTDSETGIGNVLIENYNGIIQGIDDKIAREERRVDMVRERLEEKFARLETLLSELQGQSSYLELQLSKLPGIGTSK
ncbi:MAG: flagellar filament capping protein FliD [Thermodesulfobacteriota bacterium]